MISCLDNPLPFAPVHGRLGWASHQRGSRLDFDECQNRAIPSNQVKFYAMQSSVAGDNRVTGAAKIPVGQRLTAFAGLEVGGTFAGFLAPGRVSQARALALFPNQRSINQPSQ